MFPLQTKVFPSTSAELSRLLDESLRQMFLVKADPVSVSGESFPSLERIEINLDRAELRTELARPSLPDGAPFPALELGKLQLDATELSLGPASVNFHLAADDVRFDQATDAKGEIVLMLRSAKDGHIKISASKAALEETITTLVRGAAEKHGVNVEDVSLVATTRGPRSVTAEVKIKARKLFLGAVIRVAANLDIDEQLNAVLSALTCQGEGTLGTLACGMLAPHLQKMDGRSFPLVAMPLGEVRLRDIQIAAGEQISVRAEFGAAPAAT